MVQWFHTAQRTHSGWKAKGSDAASENTGSVGGWKDRPAGVCSQTQGKSTRHTTGALQGLDTGAPTWYNGFTRRSERPNRRSPK